MIIVLTGATGTGKSRLAIELAKKLDAEIINGDAFQVYKDLTIATAAPSNEEKAEIPHHLFQYVDLSENYSIAQYQKDCRETIKEILTRKENVIIVGGSGLYLRAALYDYDLSLDTEKVDMSPYQNKNNEELHQILEKLDKDEADKLPMQNRQRILRSIQICLAAGRPKTELLAEQSHCPIYPSKFYVLHIDRESLYPKVNERVDKMFEMGLLEETLPLIEKYGREAQAFKAIGVKELFAYLDGEISLEMAKDLIKLDTRRYIKRQETFFRHQFDAKMISSLNDILDDLNDGGDNDGTIENQ